MTEMTVFFSHLKNISVYNKKNNIGSMLATVLGLRKCTF